MKEINTNELSFSGLSTFLVSLEADVQTLKKLVHDVQRFVTPANETPMNLEECSKFIHKSPNTIYRLVNEGKIPYYNKGNLFFFKSEIIEWIKGKK
jgi:predicted DNA-binding transcriptional regulator AlpA